MSENLGELAQIAESVARDAGDLLRDRYFRRRDLVIDAKSNSYGDFVTEADRAAHDRIVELLQMQRPNDAVLSEEGVVARSGDVPFTWIVDPLDGTVNFVKGIPHWCVSIACRSPDRRTVVGAIYDACRDEMFVARVDGGALLNGVPLQVSSVATFADATLVTSLMPGDHNRPFQTRFLAELAAGSAGSRSLWSPALDLAWVACARVDAFVEYGLADWDVDAGELLVREAGGVSASWVWEGYNGTMSANSVGVLGEIAVRIERA